MSIRFSSKQIVVMVVAVCAAVVLAPVGVMAATGSLVNIVDPSNASHKAHVDSSGHVLVASGTQAVRTTVGNAVSTHDADSTVEIINASTSSTVNNGSIFINTTAYSQVRLAVRVFSGCVSVQGHAKDSAAFILDASECASFTSVYDVPPGQIEVNTTGTAQVLAWGHR
jgi:hypothetical protein